MKKKLIVSATLVLVIIVGLAYGNNILLKIPTRVFKQEVFWSGLTTTDFGLNINQKPQLIQKLESKIRRIKDFKRPRNFILKFKSASYLDQFDKVIIHMLAEVIRGEDALYIWTPVDEWFLVPTKGNKQDILKLVKGRLTEDIRSIMSIKEIDLGELRKRIPPDTENFNEHSFKNMITILKKIKSPLTSFIRKYSLPNLKSFMKLPTLFTDVESYNILIDFQQINTLPFIKALEEICLNLQNYVGGLSLKEQESKRNDSKLVQEIKDLLIFEKLYPFNSLNQMFASINLSYNPILFINQTQGKNTQRENFSDFSILLGRIARLSGGILVQGSDFIKAINQICEYEDHYYDLVFKFDGVVEEKRIDIEIVSEKKIEINFRPVFYRNEIQFLTQFTVLAKLRITDFICQEGQLGFTLKDYLIDAQQKIGLIKVEVNFIDNNNKTTWTTQNTLKSKNKEINIKGILLPKHLKGAYKVQIVAEDGFGGSRVEFTEYVKI